MKQKCYVEPREGAVLAAARFAAAAAHSAADPLVSISPTNHRETEATLMVILCHDVAVNCARLNEVFDLKQKAFSHARAVFSHLASSLA